MELFLESCRWNPDVDWVLMNDKPFTACPLPTNVRLKYISLFGFLDKSARTLGISLDWDNAYKICDLRLAFGHIFEDIISGYDFFGWTDLDVIYGKMSRFITQKVFDHDCISFCDNHLNGHLCLFRNTHFSRYWYRSREDWQNRMQNKEYTHFDEISPSELSGLSVYCRESFNTPLSPKIPWTSGTFDFPSEWYWQNGELTNNKDGTRDFLYLHFMHWKGGWWPRRCGNAQWERLECLVNLKRGECRGGFRINEYGFFPLKSG